MEEDYVIASKLWPNSSKTSEKFVGKVEALRQGSLEKGFSTPRLRLYVLSLHFINANKGLFPMNIIVFESLCLLLNSFLINIRS